MILKAWIKSFISQSLTKEYKPSTVSLCSHVANVQTTCCSISLSLNNYGPHTWTYYSKCSLINALKSDRRTIGILDPTVLLSLRKTPCHLDRFLILQTRVEVRTHENFEISFLLNLFPHPCGEEYSVLLPWATGIYWSLTEDPILPVICERYPDPSG